MAIKTPLRPIARRIAAAVEDYANSQGLPKGAYILAGAWDPQTEHMRLRFGTNQPIDERQWYAGIREAMRHSFGGDPWVSMHTGLVVETVHNLDDVYRRFLLADEEDDITDMLERA